MTFRALCIPVRLRRKNYNKVYGKCPTFFVCCCSHYNYVQVVYQAGKLSKTI